MSRACEGDHEAGLTLIFAAYQHYLVVATWMSSRPPPPGGPRAVLDAAAAAPDAYGLLERIMISPWNMCIFDLLCYTAANKGTLRA